MKIQKSLALLALVSSVAFANDSPNPDKVVTVDVDRQYELSRDPVEPETAIWYGFLKTTNIRTVLLAKERQSAPKTVYVVKEMRQITKAEKEWVPFYAEVERRDPGNSAKWQYKPNNK